MVPLKYSSNTPPGVIILFSQFETFSCYHLGPKVFVEMVATDVEVVEEEEMFDVGVFVSNLGEILMLVIEGKWLNATSLFDFEWIAATLVFIFDSKWTTSMKGG